MDTNTASTLPKKKLSKSKLKKTVKNVLCRPEPVFWPSITEEQKQKVETILSKYKVQIPEFKKPLWKDLKAIPKEERPRPPRIEKVAGLIFGISQCTESMNNDDCSAIMLEASVNPRTIIQPVLDECVNQKLPVICVEDLRKITASYFGIPTTCLGVTKEYLSDVSELVSDIGLKKQVEKPEPKSITNISLEKEISKEEITPMDTSVQFEYLYRSNKKTRVFVPPSEGIITKDTNQFIGQDYIKLAAEVKQSKKPYMKMVVKRISSNPNRPKKK